MHAVIACSAMVLLLAGPLAGAARADCNCLYNGQRYEQEDTVCMRTPQGMRMARCGMLENVAWWQMLDEPCPGTVSESLHTPKAPPPAQTMRSPPISVATLSRNRELFGVLSSSGL
ncbi:MAG: hypothetical protein IT563_07840 [Alphaproteobacteria bacterium]|nr:hypothetical protein [Alphaproteobacteria bacterium]